MTGIPYFGGIAGFGMIGPRTKPVGETHEWSIGRYLENLGSSLDGTGVGDWITYTIGHAPGGEISEIVMTPYGTTSSADFDGLAIRWRVIHPPTIEHDQVVLHEGEMRDMYRWREHVHRTDSSVASVGYNRPIHVQFTRITTASHAALAAMLTTLRFQLRRLEGAQDAAEEPLRLRSGLRYS